MNFLQQLLFEKSQKAQIPCSFIFMLENLILSQVDQINKKLNSFQISVPVNPN